MVGITRSHWTPHTNDNNKGVICPTLSLTGKSRRPSCPCHTVCSAFLVVVPHNNVFMTKFLCMSNVTVMKIIHF